MPFAEMVCDPGNTSNKFSNAVLFLMFAFPAITKNCRVCSGPYSARPGPMITVLLTVVLVPRDCLLDGPFGPKAPWGPANTLLSTVCNGPLPGTITPAEPPGKSVS